jgi:hypothetical protein
MENKNLKTRESQDEEQIASSPLGFLVRMKRGQMNAQDEKNINNAVDVAWSLLKAEPSAKSSEERESWNNDKLLYWKERVKYVSPLKESDRPCVDNAIEIWKKYETEFLEVFELNREEVFKLFHLYRKSFISGNEGKLIDIKNPLGYLERYFFVRNIQTIHAFTWLLPFSDRKNAKVYKEVGKMMIVVFYMERFQKFGGVSFAIDPKEHDSFCNVELEYIAAFGEPSLNTQ